MRNTTGELVNRKRVIRARYNSSITEEEKERKKKEKIKIVGMPIVQLLSRMFDTIACCFRILS